MDRQVHQPNNQKLIFQILLGIYAETNLMVCPLPFPLSVIINMGNITG